MFMNSGLVLSLSVGVKTQKVSSLVFRSFPIPEPVSVCCFYYFDFEWSVGRGSGPTGGRWVEGSGLSRCVCVRDTSEGRRSTVVGAVEGQVHSSEPGNRL